MHFSLGKTLATLTLMVIPRAVVAADSASTQQKQNVDDLARAVKNPIANLISLPFQNNTSFEFGPEEKPRMSLTSSPSSPYPLMRNGTLLPGQFFRWFRNRSCLRGRTGKTV